MRRFVTLAAICAAVVFAAPAIHGQARNAKAPALSGGNGLLYIGTYKGEIEIYDEATEKMVGTIKLKTGIPRSLTPSPDNKYLILFYKTATKLVDRWEIGPPTIQQYDLTTHQFGRVIPFPRGEERESVNLRIGPDGKHVFLFGPEEVSVLETTNFTEVETWPFGQPADTGLGRINLGPVHDFYDPPGTFTGLFTMQDGPRARRIMGIGRVDLQARKLDFSPLGPATSVQPFAQAPDHKKAYGISQDIGDYEFWTFDLEKNTVEKRTRFEGRPRLGLRVSSNGKLFYVYVAGATLDVYEAATHKYLRTIQLGGDQTTELFVVPGKAPATSTAAR
jgi:hypothetical protein